MTTRAKRPFLLSATAVALYFCYLMAKPFLYRIEDDRDYDSENDRAQRVGYRNSN